MRAARFLIAIPLLFAAATARSAPPPFLQACEIEGLESKALCGRYEVFEDRAAKRGRKIGLNMVVLPALAPKAAPDPIFFIAGGPGQSAASLAGLLGGGPLAKHRQERDLVFLDQRGTGESGPLNCDLFADDADVESYFEDMFPAKQVRACRDQLEKRADLSKYTTSLAIADLDDVRRALGYGKINLYGGSYRTTVALAYMRQYPAQVRTVVL